ncbi:MAG TPA: hypothetical protein VKC60_05815 [Opitutaceae bacterium]|nr:hypothetical protein [Opitutaceae bacterium]
MPLFFRSHLLRDALSITVLFAYCMAVGFTVTLADVCKDFITRTRFRPK